ncbi:MAG: hypothetical protein AB7N76_16400 [Planctomycetota bacterium]
MLGAALAVSLPLASDLTLQGWLLLSVVVAAGMGYAGFVLGDRRRRREGGQAGPRPAPSIGEAVSQAERTRGRALVLFLGDDDASVEVARAFAEDEGVLRLLGREDLSYVVLREAREGREVLEMLFQKYSGDPLPGLPAALLLNGAGERLRAARLEGPERPVEWLAQWLGTAVPRET